MLEDVKIFIIHLNIDIYWIKYFCLGLSKQRIFKPITKDLLEQQTKQRPVYVITTMYFAEQGMNNIAMDCELL